MATWSRTISSELVLSLAMRGLSVGFKTVQVIALVRIYGAERYGFYTIAMGIFMITMVIGRLGLDHYSLREANSRNPDAYARVFRLSLFVVLPTAVAAVLALAVVSIGYERSVFRQFAVLAGATPFFALSWNQLYLLRGSGRVNQSLLILEILQPAVLIGIAYPMRRYELGLPTAFLLAVAFTALVTYRSTKKLRSKEAELKLAPGLARTAIRDSRAFYSLSILEAAQSLADSLAVGFFLRPVDAASYAVVTRVGTVVVLPITVTSIYMNNIAARLRGERLSLIMGKLKSLALGNFALSLAVAVGALAFRPLVERIFDIQFSVSAERAYVFVVIAQFVGGSTEFVRSILYMGGREHVLSKTSAIMLAPYASVLLLGSDSGGLALIGGSFFSFVFSYRLILSIFLWLQLRQERS